MTLFLLFTAWLCSLCALSRETVDGGALWDGQTYLDMQSSRSVCAQIAHSMSPSSAVYYPGSENYWRGVHHFRSSASEKSACVVEPGTAQDVGTLLQTLGATRTPFAVKSGGHAMNIGFSSTTGVQIAMVRFNSVTYDGASSTATVGAGAIWGDVYTALYAHNVTVIGAESSSVGVSGVLLGGGYSFRSNEYGLALDNIAAMELVMPNGTVKTVTQSDSDLWFGLRGGFNNFGIVTKFTLKTYPQTLVWGGTITYDMSNIDAFSTEIVNFRDKWLDCKTSMTVWFLAGDESAQIHLSLQYQAPTPPKGMFDELLSIPFISQDLKTRSFLDQVTSPGSSRRSTYGTIPLTRYTPKLLRAVANETKFWRQRIAAHPGSDVAYLLEFFLPDMLMRPLDTHKSLSAYPPSRKTTFLPFCAVFLWDNPAADSLFASFAKESVDWLKQLAIAEGQDIEDGPMYPNYAVAGTDLRKMYGDNVAKLREMREGIDPKRVMDLTGGWKF